MTQSRGLRPLDPIFNPSKRVGAISVGNTPGGNGTLDLPRFNRPGTLNTTWSSTVWNSEGIGTWTECVVDFPSGTSGDAAIEFDILVDGVVIESITLGTSDDQVAFPITVPVIRDSKITIEVTDDGGGTTTDISFTLRLFVEPLPDPIPIGGPGLIQLIGYTDFIVQTGSTTITAPTRAVGDRLLMQVHSPNNSGQWASGQSTPTGWSILQQASGASNNETHTIHHRVADGTSADDAALNAPLSGIYLIRMTSWSNVDPANATILPAPAVYNSDTTPFVAPAIIHATRQNVTLRMYGGDNSPSLSPEAFYPLYAEDDSGSFIVAGVDRDGEGSAGTSDLTLGSAEQGAAISIGLRPLLVGVPTVRFGATHVTSSSTVTPGFPSNVAAGDIAYLCIAIRWALTPTPSFPGGWSLVSSLSTTSPPSGDRYFTYIYNKTCDGSEDSTTVSVTGADGYAAGLIFTVRGAGSFGSLTTETENGLSFTGPTGTDDYGILIMLDHNGNAASLDANANDDLFPTVVRAVNLINAGSFSNLAVRVMPYDATGPATLSVAGSNYAHAFSWIAWT